MNDITYITGNEKHGYLIEECIKLDKVSYSSEYIGDFDFYKKSFDVNPQNFSFAIHKNTGELAGYNLAVSINDEAYDILKEGNKIDTKFLNEEHLSQSTVDKKVYLYSTVVNPKFRGLGISKRLTSHVMNNSQLENDNKITIKSYLADIINPKIYETMISHGFKSLKVTERGSIIIEKIVIK